MQISLKMNLFVFRMLFQESLMMKHSTRFRQGSIKTNEKSGHTKANNQDLILFQKQMKQIDKQIANITKAIARGVDEDIMIDQINGLNQSKKDLQKRIDEAVLEELPTVSKKDIKEVLSMFSTYIKENNTIECKRFIDNYIDKIVCIGTKLNLF